MSEVGETITISVQYPPPSLGARLFSQPRAAFSGKSAESDLLKSIRSAFQGEGQETSPTFRADTRFLSNPHIIDEIAWDETTILHSVCGVAKQKWSFKEEGQSIQFACFGLIVLPGTHKSHLWAMQNTGKQTQTSIPNDTKSGERDSFGPFFRARKNKTKEVERTRALPAIYVFLRGIGKVFVLGGQEYTFNLPFNVQRAWRLFPHGVLVQRALEPNEHEDSEDDLALPVLYTITDPHQEPRPIGVTEGITGDLQDTTIPQYERDGSRPVRFMPIDEQVLWMPTVITVPCSYFIITINHKTKKVSFWRSAYIAPEDNSASSSSNRPSKEQPEQRRMSVSRGGVDILRQTVNVGDEKMMRGSNVRRESMELEATQPVDPTDTLPLAAIPGIPPTLSDFATLGSLDSGGSGVNSQLASSLLTGGRRGSLTKNDLSSTMDRMALGRRDELSGPYPVSVDFSRLQPTYWVEKFYEYDDLTEKDWRKMTIHIFDHRHDGKQRRFLLALCLPMSKKLTIFTVALDTKKKAIHCSLLTSRESVMSIAPVNATRMEAMDLLVLQSNSKLVILTFDLHEIPIILDEDSLEDREFLPSLDVNIDQSSDDDDRSMHSVFDSQRVVDLIHYNVTTVVLVFEDGSRSAINLDLVPKDHLTTKIIKALPLSITSGLFHQIYTRFIRNWLNNNKSQLSNIQFDCIAEAILSVLGLSWHSSETGRKNAGLSSWERLAHSSSHSRLYSDVSLQYLVTPLRRVEQHASLQLSQSSREVLESIMEALHVLAEELRLTTCTYEALSTLITLLAKMVPYARPGWAEYWKRIFPDVVEGWAPESGLNVQTEPVYPMDASAIFFSSIASENATSALDSLLRRQPCSFPFGIIEHSPLLRELAPIFIGLLYPGANNYQKKAEASVKQLAMSGFSSDILGHISMGLTAPLKEALRSCQLSPPNDWPLFIYDFVGRKDLTASVKEFNDPIFYDGYRSMADRLTYEQPRKTFKTLFSDVHRALHHGEETVTGVEIFAEDFSTVRFGQDRRIIEVCRILCSATVPTIRMVDRPDLNDHELVREQQAQVHRTAERTLSLPLGRAMFTYATMPIMKKEVYIIPKIELSIRLQPYNITLAPEPGKVALEAQHWAEFHNGVAAALRISPSSSSSVDSSWITFNKPTELSAEHAGFLFGLGLNGHLKDMLTWDTFGYLVQKHDLTSIGVLLGLSAANVGSESKFVTKLLAVHTPALLPSPDVDLNIALPTQAAGLVGIGLLYMGTKNRRMAEVALHQMSRPDLVQPDISNEFREAYTIAAALSFGMVMLGKGSTASNAADQALLSRLRVLIHGEGPFVARGQNTKATFDLNLTSPAATIALGLMYMRTERKDIADILAIPDSVMALNHVQPDFLLFRTVARGLIMWNDIMPTKAWIHSQLPPPLRRAVDAKKRGEFVEDVVELAFYHITAGACYAVALKFAGSALEEPLATLIEYYDFFANVAGPVNASFDHRIKRATIRDSLNLIAMALGIVMAGTGDLAVLQRLRYAHGLSHIPVRYGSHVATHMAIGMLFLGEGRFTLGNSDAAIACLIASFYPNFPMLAADTKGYLPALRHLWVLAVESRCFVARDIDTKEFVYLPVKVRIKDTASISAAQMVMPTLLPDIKTLISIKVDTPRYWPFIFLPGDNPNHRNLLTNNHTVYVKRRTMFLSYKEDPRGSRSLFARTGSSTADAASLDFPKVTDVTMHPASDLQMFIGSYSNDITFLSFADRFCRGDGVTEEEKIFNVFCHAVLLDCIAQDKPQMLGPYLSLYRARVANPRSRYFQLLQQELLRAAKFNENVFKARLSRPLEAPLRPALFRESSVFSALHVADEKLRAYAQRPEFQRALRSYVLNQGDVSALYNSPECPDLEQHLAWYLNRHAVPTAQYLPVLRELAQEALATHSGVPPPDGILGTDKGRELEEGVKLVLHATMNQVADQTINWTIESFEDVLNIWKTN